MFIMLATIYYTCNSLYFVRESFVVNHRDNNLLGNLHAVSVVVALHLHGGNKCLSRGNFVVAVVCMIDHI